MLPLAIFFNSNFYRHLFILRWQALVITSQITINKSEFRLRERERESVLQKMREDELMIEIRKDCAQHLSVNRQQGSK